MKKERYIESGFFRAAVKEVNLDNGVKRRVDFMLNIDNARVSDEQLDRLLSILDNAVSEAKTLFD